MTSPDEADLGAYLRMPWMEFLEKRETYRALRAAPQIMACTGDWPSETGKSLKLPLEVGLQLMVSRPPACDHVVELLNWFDEPDQIIVPPMQRLQRLTSRR
ncbi:hypothetical protein DPEC_G00038770 [Dallia pectoralis]|uniref:Uncharacterized protein n=1 Tax=Dallia pectoralis TaxID=75939 RepID=A0ACC2HEZ6_DALPE|nr:hypothetical protein DPEC_G00038770 [Dallia pectoralis]